MKPSDWIGKPCSFVAQDGKTLVGIIVECVETVPFGVGNIPDYQVTVRGQSGKTKRVSLCESYLRITETP